MAPPPRAPWWRPGAPLGQYTPGMAFFLLYAHAHRPGNARLDVYVHMVLYGVFFQPVDAFPGPSGPLSASVSPATIKDVNGISDMCAQYVRVITNK